MSHVAFARTVATGATKEDSDACFEAGDLAALKVLTKRQFHDRFPSVALVLFREMFAKAIAGGGSRVHPLYHPDIQDLVRHSPRDVQPDVVQEFRGCEAVAGALAEQ